MGGRGEGGGKGQCLVRPTFFGVRVVLVFERIARIWVVPSCVLNCGPKFGFPNLFVNF